MIKIICKQCGKVFFDYLSNQRQFCSKKCGYDYQFEVPERHPRWKGADANYIAKHNLIKKQKGKPKICEHCYVACKERRLSWANIDHKYSRNLEDYISLCYSCHRLFDYKYNLKSNNKIGTNQYKKHSYQSNA